MTLGFRGYKIVYHNSLNDCKTKLGHYLRNYPYLSTQKSIIMYKNVW